MDPVHPVDADLGHYARARQIANQHHPAPHLFSLRIPRRVDDDVLHAERLQPLHGRRGREGREHPREIVVARRPDVLSGAANPSEYLDFAICNASNAASTASRP